VTRWLWVFPQQEKTAMERQVKELVSIQKAITSFHENLTYLAHEYANYPEIQKIMATPNKIDIELGKEEFDLARYELQYFAFADIDNDITLGLYRSDNNSNIHEFSDAQKALLTERLNNSENTAIIESFELFRGQPVMAVTYPIFSHKNNNDVLGRLVISWKLYGSSLNQISDIVQLKIKPSSIDEINQSEKIGLYKEEFKDISDKHIRCLYDNSQVLVNCLTIYHDTNLIPKFLSLTILARTLAFSIIPLIFFIIMLNYFIRPLEKATLFLKNISTNKEITSLSEKAPIAELEEMRIAFNELVEVTLLQKEQLALQSMTDALTLIPNRRAFDKSINKMRSRLQRHGGSAAVIMCDIDYFKLFNDNYGHLHGDEVLKKVATALHQFGRRTDEICARYGGEEFAIVLSEIEYSELENILSSINKTIRGLKEPHEFSQHSVLTLSCGAIFINCKKESKDLDSVLQWIESADKALYQAKEDGRDCYRISIIESH
jgi:diguanylate cyclase (GGDEF)-like protein